MASHRRDLEAAISQAAHPHKDLLGAPGPERYELLPASMREARGSTRSSAHPSHTSLDQYRGGSPTPRMPAGPSGAEYPAAAEEALVGSPRADDDDEICSHTCVEQPAVEKGVC